MNHPKVVLYIGMDPQISDSFSNFILSEGIKDVTLTCLPYTKGAILEGHFRKSAKLIFCDLEHIADEEELLKEILFIRKNEKVSSPLFVSLIPEIDALEAHKNLIFLGTHYCHVKDLGLERPLRDGLSLAYGYIPQSIPPLRTLGLDQLLKVCTPSALCYLEGNDFRIDSDFESRDDYVQLRLPFFPDLNCDKFKIKEFSESSYVYPKRFSYLLELPVIDQRESASGEALNVDTFETWKVLHEQLAGLVPVRIMIFSENTQLLRGLFPMGSESRFQVEFQREVDPQVLAAKVKSQRVHLIFFDLDITNQFEGNIQKLQEVAQVVALQSPVKTIIVSTRNPSSSETIQKLFRYNFILSSGRALDQQTVSTLAKLYYEKKFVKEDPPLVFTPTIQDRRVDVSFEILLTSMTEHEITFYSVYPLPLFGLLRFHLPLEFLATVVPPTKELPERNGNKMYMAYIHGIDQKGLALLKRMIDQMIEHPPIDLSQKTVSEVLDFLRNHNTI